MKQLLTIFFILGSYSLFCQNQLSKPVIDSTQIDFNYREDQFYAGLTYDLLVNKPDGVSQQGFSRGIHLGLLRDMPFNRARTLSFATGIGYSYDLIYSDIYSSFKDGKISYIIGNLKVYDVSETHISTHSIDIPIEFRWRNSIPQSHKFWRIYTGFKLSYTYLGRCFYTKDELNIAFKNPDLMRKWQVKAYSAFGYNTWNFYIQYHFLPLFDNQSTDQGIPLNSSLLQLGLMFYIL